MKPKMKRTALQNNDDIWNAVVQVLNRHDLNLRTRDKVIHEAFLVFQYYSELESGGHESLFTWFKEYIEDVGIEHFVKELVTVLEKIGAHDIAQIESTYALELWRLFIVLENDGTDEDAFYSLIKKADERYYSLNGLLDERLAEFFVHIHTDLIDVLD